MFETISHEVIYTLTCNITLAGACDIKELCSVSMDA